MNHQLKELREAKDITKEEMAQELEISVSHLYSIENGRRKLGVDKAILAAKKLGVSLDTLFFYSPISQNEQKEASK